MKKALPSLLWILALVVLVSLCWCITRDRMSWTNWDYPIEYGPQAHGGDSLSGLAGFKAASEGECLPLSSKYVSRLGAPYEANWNDFPLADEFFIFFVGILVKIFGLFKASNIAVLFAHVSAAISFFLCCRFLRVRREWAWVCAALFGLTYYNFFRGLGHLFMALTYTIPPAILVCWLVGGSRRLRWRSKLCWFCLGVSLVLGLTNPYWLNLYAQLLCLSLVVQFFTRRRKVNLQIGVACLFVGAAGFFLSNLDTFLYQWAHGKNALAMQRGYYETELFALKPIELVMPPASHHSETLARLATKYIVEAWLRGEVFSPYLGFVCVAGIVWMAYEASCFMFTTRRRRGRLAAHLPQAVWVLIYSIVGGLNCVIGILGIPLFRGSNRFSIFLSALILFFIASRLSRGTRKWQIGPRLLLAAGILAVGLYDQMPLATSPAETAFIARQIAVDRNFVQKMEESLPNGAMVFQLPVMQYPESGSVNGVQPYDHMRPYFLSKSLRFSFGSHKGRPREDWQKDVEKLGGAEMAQTLERYGFAAICMNRRGYNDRGESLLKQIQASGRAKIIEDENQEHVCVVLNPSATPVKPPVSDRVVTLVEPNWLRGSETPTGLQYLSSGKSGILFFPAENSNGMFEFSAQLGSVVAQRISIEVNGKEQWSANFTPNQMAPARFTFAARSGKNRLVFKSDSAPRPTGQNPTPQAFIVINPQVTAQK